MKMKSIFPRLFATLALLMCIVVPSTATAPVPPDFFGITIVDHNNYPTVSFGTLGKGAQTGMSYLEQTKNVFVWTILDAYVAEANSHGVPFHWAHEDAPPWAVTDQTSCHTSIPGIQKCTANVTDIAGLDAFYTALTTRYNGLSGHGHIDVFELYNEPEGGFTGTIANLVTQTNDLATAVRANAPSAKVAGLQTTYPDNYYASGGLLDQYWAAGGTKSLDAVGFHGYPHHGTDVPEVVNTFVPFIKAALVRNGISSTMPIYQTEGSWGDVTQTGWTVTDPAQQAAWVARTYLLAWSQGVSRYIWYGWDAYPWGALWYSSPPPAGLTSGVNQAGIAYTQVYNWMVGSTMTSPCVANGTIWTCGLTKANGQQTLAVWNTAGSSSYTPASQYVTYNDLTGITHTVSGSVTIGIQPLLFQAGSAGCITGNWTIANQPPDNCIPFPTGIFAIPIPNGGNGGPTTHLFAGSDAIIANVMNPGASNFCPGCGPGGAGYMLAAGPGNYVGDGIGEPIYFGRASDPIYKVSGCNLNTGDNYPTLFPLWDPIGKTYHIPNKAMPANTNPATGISTCHDSFMVVWDQTSNEVLGVYNGCTAQIGLPNCTATTPATACATPGWRSCDQANWSTDKGYQVKPGATGALDVPGWALTIRTQEWIHGLIAHAIYLNTGCENGPSTVFPDMDGPAGVCSSAQVQGNYPGITNTNRLFEGNMVFLDYTDAQLLTLKASLPAWQYPIIVAMTHYGGYVGDTGQGSGNIGPSRVESNQAYAQAGTVSPLYAWLEGQSGVSKNQVSAGVYQYAMSAFSNVPLVGGTGITSHMHVADPCVPLGLAGLAGGCVSAAPPGIDDIPDAGGVTSCTTDWCWIHDTGTAGTASATSSLVTSPALDGQSRKFAISWTALGGLRASVVTNPTKLDSTSTNFVYDTEVQLSDLTHVNALEFDLNQVVANGDTVIFGTQCYFVGGFWQYTVRNGAATQWINSTIPCSKTNWTANAWHHLTIAFHRDTNGIVTYDSVTLDGVVSQFTGAFGPSNFALGWTPIGEQVINFQVDGDNTANSTNAYLDQTSVTASGSSALIAFVQSNNQTSSPATSAGSLLAAYPTNQTSSNTNIIAVGWNDATSTIASVTDTQGNTYKLAVGPTRGTLLSQSIYYASNIKAGANTVFVTFNQTVSHPDLRIYEYAGLDSANPFDVAAVASGSSTLANSGSATTTAANELIFGAGMTFTVYSAAGTGFTSRGITNFGDIGEDKIVGSIGAYNATAPVNPTGPWLFQVVGFKASGSTQQTIGHFYTTTFPLLENPISENGAWIDGQTVGLDWNNVSSTLGPGKTNGDAAGGLFNFSDALAFLTGTWGPNQTITATVWTGPTPPGPPTCYPEVEMRLRNTLAAHVQKGYEISYSIGGGANAYLIIVRSNGAEGNFTYLLNVLGSQYAVGNGDIVSASIVGNTISAFKNGVLMGTATDSTFSTGTPGLGFNTENPSGSCIGTNVDYGFSKYTASDSVVVSPPVVTAVSPNSGIVSGGNTVAISGTGFIAGAVVRFGGNTATNTVVSSSTSITVTAPTGALGLTSVSVTNPDGQVGTLNSAYIYNPVNVPVTVTSISPNTGDIAGGTAVTIGGTGFLTGPNVTIGGIVATSIRFVNATTITAVTPAHGTGAANIAVTNTNNSTGTLTNGYTYTTTGGGGGNNIISVQPSPWDFGGSNVSVPGNPKTFTVTNPGTSSINVLNISFGGANPTDFSKVSDTCTGANTVSNGTCTFGVVFSAGAVGLRQATIVISGTGFTTSTTTIQGTGLFVITGSVITAPISLSFGNITTLSASPTQPVNIINNTNASVTVGTIISSLGDFTLASNPCNGQVLAASVQCTFTVRFTPASNGSRTGTITIPGTGFTSLVIPVDGTGIALPLPPSGLIAIVN